MPSHCPLLSRPVAALRRRSLVLSGLAALTTSSLGAAPAARPAPGPAAAASFLDHFKGLKLVDHDNRRLLPERLAGRVLLTNFVFTGCSTVCPMQMRALVELQQQLPAAVRGKVHLLSLSLDPLGDTPQALRAFATRLGVDFKGWTLATGRPEDVDRLSQALALFRPGPDTRKPDDHSTALWLADAQGQLRMRYGGNPPDLPRLLREVTALAQLPATPNS